MISYTFRTMLVVLEINRLVCQVAGVRTAGNNDRGPFCEGKVIHCPLFTESGKKPSSLSFVVPSSSSCLSFATAAAAPLSTIHGTANFGVSPFSLRHPAFTIHRREGLSLYFRSLPPTFQSSTDERRTFSGRCCSLRREREGHACRAAVADCRDVAESVGEGVRVGRSGVSPG